MLLMGAIIFGFRDSIFKQGSNLTSSEVQDAIDESAKVADPMPTEPMKPSFTKTPQRVGGK